MRVICNHAGNKRCDTNCRSRIEHESTKDSRWYCPHIDTMVRNVPKEMILVNNTLNKVSNNPLGKIPNSTRNWYLKCVSCGKKVTWQALDYYDANDKIPAKWVYDLFYGGFVCPQCSTRA